MRSTLPERVVRFCVDDRVPTRAFDIEDFSFEFLSDFVLDFATSMFDRAAELGVVLTGGDGGGAFL